VFGYKPPLLLAIASTFSSLAAVEQYLQQRKDMLSVLKKELVGAQNRMKQAASKKRSDRTFEIGDKVFLKVRRSLQQPFTSTPASKLNPKYFGPYVIEARVRKIPYKLRLHEGINMHPVFRVSLLKKSIKPRGTTSQQLPTAEDELEETLEPQAILDKRVVYQGAAPLTQVLVQWSLLQSDHTIWEYLPELLTRFPLVVSLL